MTYLLSAVMGAGLVALIAYAGPEAKAPPKKSDWLCFETRTPKGPVLEICQREKK